LDERGISWRWGAMVLFPERYEREALEREIRERERR
jgi:hypothetical protein